jgi:hypothetical protein
VWAAEGALDGAADAATGTVLAVGDGTAAVAVGGRRLVLGGLRDGAGEPLSADALRARGVAPGARCRAPTRAPRGPGRVRRRGRALGGGLGPAAGRAVRGAARPARRARPRPPSAGARGRPRAGGGRRAGGPRRRRARGPRGRRRWPSRSRASAAPTPSTSTSTSARCRARSRRSTPRRVPARLDVAGAATAGGRSSTPRARSWRRSLGTDVRARRGGALRGVAAPPRRRRAGTLPVAFVRGRGADGADGAAAPR